MIIRVITGIIILVGLYPFFLAASVLLPGGDIDAELVGAYFLGSIAFFCLAIAINYIPARGNRGVSL